MTTTLLASTETRSSVEKTLLERVMGYENSAVVHRYMDKLGLNEKEAVLLFEDTKRFLYLCGSKQRGDFTLAPPETVDAGWHEFLLFTEDYQSFCRLFFGRFIHHRPRRPEDPKGDGHLIKSTRELAIATFGDLSENWRLTAENADCNDDCGCGPLSTNCQDPQ